MSSSKFLQELRKRAIKNFMDVLILTQIKKRSLSGYDIIAHIHAKYGILLSSGTVYSLLYSLERQGLIRGVWSKRKRIYELTERGEQNIRAVMKANEEIQNFLRNISLLNISKQSKAAF